jgi:hypothetical protein
MSRKRHGGGLPFIGLPHWVYDSKAWGELSGNEQAVLLAVWRRWNGSNNGQIVFSTQNAGDAIRASERTGGRALKRLIEIGFLRVVRDATFRSEEARPFLLTTLPNWIGGPATKEFANWNGRPATADKSAKNHFPASPMTTHSVTHDAGNSTVSKATNKINGLSGGAGSGKNGTSATPSKTANRPKKTAKNRDFPASPMTLDRPSSSVMGDDHIIYQPVLLPATDLGLTSDLDVQSDKSVAATRLTRRSQ